MLISVDSASVQLDVSPSNLTNPNSKYGKFYKKGKFDITAYSEAEAEKKEYHDYILETVGLAEFVRDTLGETIFYKKIPTLKRQNVREGIIKNKFSESIAKMVRELYEAEWLDDYLNADPLEKDIAPVYVPIENRAPLTKSYIMHTFWASQKTTLQIAKELNVPEFWVQGEIRRLGLQKKENGIIRKGRKGYKMPEGIKVKHQNQPHAKPIVQICPKTFIILKEYNSQAAVERFGFKRENVRKAIKSGGLSKGYLWAFKDLAEVTIRVAKNRGTLDTKIQAYEYKRPTRKELAYEYITLGKTLEECGELFKCNKTTIAVLAGNYGLKKRTEKISPECLRRLYIDEGLSAKKIGELHGYTASSISTYLSKEGIKRCN